MRSSGIGVFALLVLGLLALTPSNSQSQVSTPPAPEPADSLAGLWGSEQIFGPTVRGELTIDARGPQWLARVGGYEAAVEHDQQELHFSLPGEAGEFRGRVSANGKEIVGQWIQLGDVAFYSYSYASPVQLSELAPRVWRGEVKPLEERASFYLSIQAVGGGLKAFLRNPEANRFRGQTFDVALKDGVVTLSQKGEARLQGSFDRGIGGALVAGSGFLSAGAVHAA